MHDCLRLGLVEGAHRLIDVLSGLRNRRFGHDANTFAAGCVSKVLQVTLADQRLLDQDADLAMVTLGQQVRPKDRFIGHRSLGKREGPLT